MAPPRIRRPGFSRRAQYVFFLGYVVAVAGVIVGVGLLLLSTFNPPAFAAFRGAASEITTPIASLFAGVRRGVATAPSAVSSYFGVVHENAQLRKQLADSRTQIEYARTLTQENRRLRALLNLRDRSVESVVAARIVASSGSSSRRYGLLNAGNFQGVKPGQPVRGPAGLIGQVIETSPDSARILLIVDPESVVPVRRISDGMPAIAAGRGDGLLDIRAASLASVLFHPGDTFVTSGTGGLFPPNIPVGRVIREARDSAVAIASANPDAIDFALVEKAFMPGPIEPPPPPPAPAPTKSPKTGKSGKSGTKK